MGGVGAVWVSGVEIEVWRLGGSGFKGPKGFFFKFEGAEQPKG